jgi:exopolyphosphatase/guanosine-5'-triphosphate,3'-diphosphate pyrophosphatase
MQKHLTILKHLETLAEHTDVYKDAQRIAIIDLGSNSFRLIVVEYVPRLSFRVIDEVREVVRLGEGMTEMGILRVPPMDRAARAMRIYAAFCRASGITDIVAVGTSAIRDAQNQARFLARIQAESGIPVRVLSGEEEAYYGYLAAVNSTTLENGFVLDLGGGSLEVSRVEGRRMTHTVSLPLGAVRVTEGFLQSDPPTDAEIEKLRKHLQKQFAPLEWLQQQPGFSLVGEGGTLRQIGKLVQKKTGYPLDELHGYEITHKQVESAFNTLVSVPLDKRQDLDGMKSDRADIAPGGTLVVLEALRAGGFSTLTICNQGMREGLFYERFLEDHQNGAPMFAKVRRASVLNLAHWYRFQEKHAEHIAHLTLSMFDQLTSVLYECGSVEREILWAASMLHDIGVSVDYNDHHKHGAYLILSAGLPGYTHREIALIALLTRYHRKGKPTTDELAEVLQPGDQTRLVQLCALLRLAEQLDRSRDGVVRDVVILTGDDWAQMEVSVRGDGQVALWAVERNRDIFREAFGLTLEVVAVPDAFPS